MSSVVYVVYGFGIVQYHFETSNYYDQPKAKLNHNAYCFMDHHYTQYTCNTFTRSGFIAVKANQLLFTKRDFKN